MNEEFCLTPIGLSFAFLKNIGSLQHTTFLLAAWTFWGVSITSVVFSHYFSHLAMRHALKDLNDNKLKYEKPGGSWDNFINFLNPFAGILFLAGLVTLLFFVSYNVKSETHTEQLHKRPTVVTTTTTTTTEDVDSYSVTRLVDTNNSTSPQGGIKENSYGKPAAAATTATPCATAASCTATSAPT